MVNVVIQWFGYGDRLKVVELFLVTVHWRVECMNTHSTLYEVLEKATCSLPDSHQFRQVL